MSPNEAFSSVIVSDWVMPSRLTVAVAVITDEQQRVLITQRPHTTTHGGYWEFPGGKLEPNESPELALLREVKEELDLDVLVFRYLGPIEHHYDTRLITLSVFHVTAFRGKPQCRESQLAMRWVSATDLPHYQFPAANAALIKLAERSGIFSKD